MAFKTFEIEINNKSVISVLKHEPEVSNSKSIVISSATGVLQKYYTNFATHFVSLGFTVYTFNYSGIGNALFKNIKSNSCNLQDWALNQSEVLAFAKQNNPNHKVILITHSIGGQLIGLNPKINLADAIITVCSQSGYWRLFKGFNRFKMFVFWYLLIPITTPLFGYFPAKKLGLFENIPKRAAYQWRRWGINKDYLLSEFKNEALYFNDVKCALLALSFPRDKFAPKQTVDWLAERFINANVDRRHILPEDLKIKDVKHFGFFRSGFKESLWEMTEVWIAKHTNN